MDYASLPEIFKIAQEQEDKYLGDQRSPKIVALPKKVKKSDNVGPKPMGPTTSKVKSEKDMKKKTTKSKTSKVVKEVDETARQKRYENELIKLIAKRERLQSIINDLDPKKKKDNKRIISINIQLRNIETDINKIQDKSGIDISDLDKGSKIGRFWNKLKDWYRRVVKKVKKFFKRHKESIIGVLIVAIPTFISIAFKWILRR